MFHYGYGMGFDPYIILVIPAFLFSLYAQFKVKSTFGKYRRVPNSRGLTGADVARRILDQNGIFEVVVQLTKGDLTDHYDPKTKIVNLSETVYSSTSVAAIGVAAHETGHAIQHKVGYAPLALRTNLVPAAGIGSQIGPYMAILGIIFRWTPIIYAGIILFTIAVVFYLVTLPVEFNASHRAIKELDNSSMLSTDELIPAKKVLSAAAMTYVASAAVAIASLLRLVLLANGRRRN